MRHLGLTFAAAMAVVSFPASAVTLTFDDVPGGGVVGAYNGFTFDNFYALDTTTFVASGYVNDVVSLNNVLYNSFALPASISAATPFSLTSGYFAGAWNDGLTITLVGTLGGAPVYTQSFVVDTLSPQFELLDSALVDSVVFSSAGGVAHGYDGDGEHFALDNLTINGTVPEPASWALMIVGFGLVGATMRRRATAVSFG